MNKELKNLGWGDYNEFAETDPFNNNFVEGFISRHSNEYYGALLITKVNGDKVTPQLIMSIPKMHYPFHSREDGTRKYSFPSAKEIEVYEKLDGTGILAYKYSYKNNWYYTYKTRLRPFLGSGKFGNFLDMWKEVATSYMTPIKRTIDKYNCNLAFELYGIRNTHLIMYDVPLAFALLFGVTNTGKIFTPSELDSELPKADQMAKINRDYVYHYEDLQKTLQNNLKKTEDYYTGSEGTVWYLKTHDGKCVQFKLKPDTIQDIHWSASKGLGRQAIIATCWNAFENTDTPSIEFIKELLREEFSSELVEANHSTIVNGFSFVKSEQEFRAKVLELYYNMDGNILAEKEKVMRNLAQHFPKSKMKKVYTIIRNFG